MRSKRHKGAVATGQAEPPACAAGRHGQTRTHSEYWRRGGRSGFRVRVAPGPPLQLPGTSDSAEPLAERRAVGSGQSHPCSCQGPATPRSHWRSGERSGQARATLAVARDQRRRGAFGEAASGRVRPGPPLQLPWTSEAGTRKRPGRAVGSGQSHLCSCQGPAKPRSRWRSGERSGQARATLAVARDQRSRGASGGAASGRVRPEPPLQLPGTSDAAEPLAERRAVGSLLLRFCFVFAS